MFLNKVQKINSADKVSLYQWLKGMGNKVEEACTVEV